MRSCEKHSSRTSTILSALLAALASCAAPASLAWSATWAFWYRGTQLPFGLWLRRTAGFFLVRPDCCNLQHSAARACAELWTRTAPCGSAIRLERKTDSASGSPCDQLDILWTFLETYFLSFGDLAYNCSFLLGGTPTWTSRRSWCLRPSRRFHPHGSPLTSTRPHSQVIRRTQCSAQGVSQNGITRKV